MPTRPRLRARLAGRVTSARGGAETVSDDLEGELQAADVDEVEQHLITELGEMLAPARPQWQVERRFPGYGPGPARAPRR